jgi:ABC-type multidrug transport system permease subunit
VDLTHPSAAGLSPARHAPLILAHSQTFEEVRVAKLDEALKKLEFHSFDLVIAAGDYYVNESSPRSKMAEAVFLKETVKPVSDKVRRVVSGKKVAYIDWLFPGIIATNVLWMALWGVGWVIVRQRKIGVLKRLKASPVKPVEYLTAQALSRMIVMAFSGIAVFALGHLIHPFHTEGSYFNLFLMYMLGCFALSSMGLVAAARLANEELVNGILNFITYPMMFLSEVWFSLEGSPEWLKNIARTMPLWHMVKAMREVMTEGASLAQLSSHIYVLGGIGVLCLALGGFLFRWNQD